MLLVGKDSGIEIINILFEFFNIEFPFDDLLVIECFTASKGDRRFISKLLKRF